MTLHLDEGQTFAADFSLLSRVWRREQAENWLALDTQSRERVLLKIFSEPLADKTRRELEDAITATRGLVHPNISRVYTSGQFEGHDYIVCQYVRGASTFDPRTAAATELERKWPVLDQLFRAVEFAHGLGIAHGHLHPGNILIDEENRVVVTDFRLPASLQHDDDLNAYLSPQVREGARPDASDDVFSLGQVLHVILTGEESRAGTEFAGTRPVPEQIRQLVSKMLSPVGYDRPTDLREISDTVRRYLTGEAEQPLEAVGGFSRQRKSSEMPAAAASQARPLEIRRRGVSAPVAIGGFAALLIAAVAIFLLLPNGDNAGPSERQIAMDPQRAATEAGGESVQGAAPAPQARELTPLERARLEQMEERGAEIAREILRLQIELEDLGVNLWAPEAFDQALEQTAEADEAYRNDAFEEALAIYDTARQALEDLLDSVPEVKELNMTAGNAALADGRPQDAIEAFTIVTAIAPDDAEAAGKMERAENLEELLAVLGEAEFQENEGELQQARETLAAAIDLDPNWQPALDARKRIERKIDEQRFREAMSTALTALADSEFDRAREYFGRAQEILPESEEPADGLEQVEIAIEQRKITELRQQAEAAEQIGDWETTIENYQAILDLDDTLVFASQGLERVQFRKNLSDQLTRFIEQPTLMSTDEELKEARQTLATAARVDEPGEQLEEKIDMLSHLIALARIPVEVEIRSDNRTDITVYRYGDLGQIDSTKIELIPGQYTIVGKRRGYRDVEVDLTLLGGNDVAPVYVAATEEI